MRRCDAESLVVLLRAAFATPVWDKVTIALYVAELEELADFELAQQAVRQLIRERTKFRPAIADVFDTYKRLRDRQIEERAARALPLPSLTDEEIAENKARIRELASRFGVRSVA